MVWTATRVDKIAPLTSTVAAAVAGDAAHADRLVGILQAAARQYEYDDAPQNDWGDVTTVRFDDKRRPLLVKSALSVSNDNDDTLSTTTTTATSSSSMTVRHVAHLARTQIASQLRTSTPCQVCLLVAGMQPGPEDVSTTTTSATTDWTRHLQTQVQTHASAFLNVDATSDDDADDANSQDKEIHMQNINENSTNDHTPDQQPKQQQQHARLYWLDELGTLLPVPYAAHGVGSMFLHSILDQGYHADMSREQAVALLHKCFAQLRQRYAVQAPSPPCIKCIDANGIHLWES